MERPSLHSDIALLNKLVEEGEHLLSTSLSHHSDDGRFYTTDKSSGIAVPLSSAIDGWLKSSADYIISQFPKRILDSDFSEVQRLQKTLAETEGIVADNSTTYLINTIDALRRCVSFFNWFDAFDEEQLPPVGRAELNHLAVKGYVSYIQEVLIPKLYGLEDGRTTKTALLHLYGRIFSLVQAIMKLNHVGCYQLLVAALRSLLEIHIDMILLKRGTIENGLEKFFCFSEVDKLRSALNLMRLDEELKRLERDSGALSKYAKNSEKIEATAMRLWEKKPRSITHWTGATLEDRARKAGALDIYREIYFYGNKYVHSGYLDFPSTEEDADFLCAYDYGFSINILKTSIELLFELVSFQESESVLRECRMMFPICGYFEFWKRTGSR